jgi:hypothetical protein
MPEKVALSRHITVDQLQTGLNLACFYDGDTIEAPEPICDWPGLCGPEGCKFPRYFRHGPAGLTAQVLLEVGFPVDLLLAMDREYELGEVLHPGVKIARSRNAALARLDSQGVALLSFNQDHQKIGWSWNDIAVAAFRPRRMIRRLDARRRPWLY